VTDKLQLCKPLLTAIRKHEAPKGYGQIYSGAKGVSKTADVSKMTIEGVLAFQSQMLAGGSKSTACGGYQFLKKTLAATKLQMGLTGNEVWNEVMQDRMAMHLMEQRGLSRYLDGMISRDMFANNLAKEWASLPVVSNIKGGSREVVRGQSYYAGDGLNKAFHKPEAIEWFLDELRKPVDAQKPVPAPTAPQDTKTAPPLTPQAPRGILAALIALIISIFKRKV
jgi:muramidase (phage lysozyme)